jgi:predicted phage terminase large subunit-like protein
MSTLHLGGGLLAPPPVKDLLSNADRLMCDRSMLEFVMAAWPHIEPETFVPGWHIDAICEHLEAVSKRQIQNLVINVPPKHAKSLLVSVLWPAWEWGPNNRPSLRFLTISYAATLSLRDAGKARQLIQSPWYQKQWGYRYQLSDDQNAKGRYNTNHNGYRVSSSIGGIGTGEGGERLIIDDPISIDESNSPVKRQTVLDWWDHVMPTRRNDPKSSATVLIMQRTHHEDLAGHIKDTLGSSYEYLVLPGEFEVATRCHTKIGWRDPRTKEGDLLWPARFGKKEMEMLKLRLGSHEYASQIQQRPSPLEGGLVQRSWWKYYQVMPPLDTFDQICQSWDLAFKALDTSSYVVGQVWGQIGAQRYLLDRVREHMTFTESIRAIVNMTDKWPQAKAKYIEDKANGPAVIDAMNKKISGLIACTPEGSKESRLWAVTPEIEAGNVFLPHPSIAPWVEEYVEQMSQFPHGAHDDDPDATSQALIEMTKRQRFMPKDLPDIISVTRANPMGSLSTRTAPARSPQD